MFYIGVDLGGTNIVVGLVDEKGNIIEKVQKPTCRERGIRRISDDIIRLCMSIIEKYNLDDMNLVGIGIGAPGTIDRKKGRIVYSNNIAVRDFDIVSYIRRKLGNLGKRILIEVANDADCAALGEVKAGRAKGYNSAIVITLGTGVGSGIVIDGRLFSGCQPGGGELGHQIIVKDGKPCTCGNKGCFEVYGSALGFTNMAREIAEKYPDSIMNKMVKGNLDKMNAKVPFDAAKQGDEVAVKLLDQYITYLAIGLNNIINAFKPEIILIGGGVSRQKESLIFPLRKKLKNMVFGGKMMTEIQVAALGSEAGIVGAAMLCEN
ncbi:ROK family protein [Cellulosilyticum ruminicola]|uniref:ROK family protein n=1 Tax=Cellulosilyticum ruminicola TaxID=425254 RepID=UPI0006D0BA07|nr:ROK family protein [Cellulosilyticum ruminicola]